MIDYTYAIEVKNSVSFVEWIRHNARPPGHLRIVFAGQTTVLLVNKSGAICKFFIMRHGDAALDAASDSVRPLTVCGCDESRQMATWLKGQKVDIERVLVSPYLRAEQTLDIVGECMNLPKHVDVMPELTPCGDVGMVSAICRRWRMKAWRRRWLSPTCRWWGIWSQSCVRGKRPRCSPPRLSPA